MTDPIDTSTGVPVGKLDHATRHHRRRAGYWQRKLIELNDLVEHGNGEYDTLYRLGSFDNRAGAYNVVRRFLQKPDSIPSEVTGTLDLEYRNVDWTDENGEIVQGSEVWGAIIS